MLYIYGLLHVSTSLFYGRDEMDRLDEKSPSFFFLRASVVIFSTPAHSL